MNRIAKFGRVYVQAVGLVALILLAYRPAFSAGWIWDDDSYITANTTLRTSEGLKRIWTQPSASPQYYPVTLTSFWIEARLWGLSPEDFHRDNIWLHADNVLLLWLILRELGVPAAWLIAAVWGVHPVNVESVAWATERKNVLSAFFYLLAAIVYLPFVTEENSKSAWRYALVLVLFLLAMLSKTVAGTFPIAMLLLIWWKRGRIQRIDFYRVVPFLLLAIPLGALTSHLEHTQVGAAGSDFAYSIIERCMIVGHAAWFYAWKIIWPGDLSFVYSKWVLSGFQIGYFVALVLAVLLLILLRGRIGRGPLAAALFFLCTVGPALGFVNVYPMRFSFVADHFQYMASIGLIALAIGAARRINGLSTKFVGRLAGVILLTILSVLTFQRASVFADSIALWRDTEAKNPGSWMVHTNLGTALLDRAEQELRANRRYQAEQDFAAAQTEYRRTLQLRSDLAEPWMNLARIEELQQHFDQAGQLLWQAMEVDQKSAEPHFHLGAVLVESGQVEEGIAEYRKALALDPRHVAAWTNLGVALDAQGKVDEAVKAYRRALEIDPDSVLACTDLGNALLQLNHHPEATEQFRRALEIEPGFLPAEAGLDAAGR